jgi:TldD protein
MGFTFSDYKKTFTASQFLNAVHLSRKQLNQIISQALVSADHFSDMFLEYRIDRSVYIEEDIIKESTDHISMGAGIRVMQGDQVGFAYSNSLEPEDLKRAAKTASAIARDKGDRQVILPPLRPREAKAVVYDLDLPVTGIPLTRKIDLIRRTESDAMAVDPRIIKVQVTLSNQLQFLCIANSEGLLASDMRPQVRLMCSALAEEKDKRYTGFDSTGGRIGWDALEKSLSSRSIGKHAAGEALLLLSSRDPVPGEQPIVLGSAQSGVMIHEAVGHLLEGDGIRKKTSILWNRLGQEIASPHVTLYDDPTRFGLRGSLHIDDEGTPAKKTLLIDKGRLTGFLQDRISARALNMPLTGNARRSSYQDYPIPRMTNTYMEPGHFTPEEIIASVKKGFFASSFQGGQVQDSGKFTFSVNLGYQIENGKLGRPIRNATLIGTNTEVLRDIEMVGNDLGFFLGTCGKEGQSVPVTAGLPTVKVKHMTVGGRL